jgi:uncharacterized protein
MAYFPMYIDLEGKRSECLKKAVGSKALEKAFKVSIPAEVYEQLDKELRDIEE